MKDRRIPIVGEPWTTHSIHWAPPPFVEWEGYNRLWPQMADRVAGLA